MLILAIDDDPIVLESYRSALEGSGVELDCTVDPTRGIEIARDRAPELIILDWKMPMMEGIEALQRLRRQDMRSEVVVIGEDARVQSVVEAIREGAANYICKPVTPEKLRSVVKEVKALFKRREISAKLQKDLLQNFNTQGIIGQSPPMLEMFDLIRRVAPHFHSVLILGETGTGKDLVARALHEMSPRKERPFVVCNCAAAVETLFEAQLFGYRKGAFTGASKDRMGLFESAEGGIIFLDEVGELGPAVQSKLLRVLENQEIQRIGLTNVQHVDVLVIAATSRDLTLDVKKGRFRADLLFRLNMIEIKVPPLRRRPEDIMLLSRYFLEKFNRVYGKEIRGTSRRAQELLVSCTWPGNVRELENVMGRACMLAQGSFLHPEDFSTLSASLDEMATSSLSLHEVERATLVRALEANPNKTQVAHTLGVNRQKLYRLMEKHGMKVRGQEADDRR